MPNGSKDTFDGYDLRPIGTEVLIQWTLQQVICFLTNHDDGLRFWTKDTIGKDRKPVLPIVMDRYNSNLWLPNVVGFTGFWRHNHRQTHPRLAMVCFHYMDATGTRGGDYRPTESLFSYDSSSHYWTYDNSGQHDSGSDWMIGYQLPANRRPTVYNSQLYLLGISLQDTFRTSASARHADGRFWNFKPIIAKDANSVVKSNAATCKSGKRLVIPARGNTYPLSGDIKLT